MNAGSMGLSCTLSFGDSIVVFFGNDGKEGSSSKSYCAELNEVRSTMTRVSFITAGDFSRFASTTFSVSLISSISCTIVYYNSAVAGFNNRGSGEISASSVSIIIELLILCELI